MSMNSQLETNEDKSEFHGNGKDIHTTDRNLLENLNEIDMNEEAVRNHPALPRAKLDSLQWTTEEKKENKNFATSLNIIYFIFGLIVFKIAVYCVPVIAWYCILSSSIAFGGITSGTCAVIYQFPSYGSGSIAAAEGNIYVESIIARGAFLLDMPFMNAPPPVAAPPPPPPDLLNDTNPTNQQQFNHSAIHETVESGQVVVQQVLQDPLPNHHPALPPPDYHD